MNKYIYTQYSQPWLTVYCQNKNKQLLTVTYTIHLPCGKEMRGVSHAEHGPSTAHNTMGSHALPCCAIPKSCTAPKQDLCGRDERLACQRLVRWGSSHSKSPLSVIVSVEIENLKIMLTTWKYGRPFSVWWDYGSNKTSQYQCIGINVTFQRGQRSMLW